MAITQKSLFSWENIEAASDLDRLRLVLGVIPDEELMIQMEAARGKGRDEYPIRAVWNSVLAGIVFQHKDIESLRRELQRNGELRALCGFDPLLGAAAVPTPSAYTNFFKLLFRFESEVIQMFETLVEELARLLPDFGRSLAVDSKAVESFGKPNSKVSGDGRRESDADWGKKTYRGVDANGRAWEKVKSWFGYKIHLLVDARYELPVGVEVTCASSSDMKHLLPLVKQTGERHPQLLERAEELSADKGYDSEENNRELYDEYGIKPLIAKREMWREGEGLEGETPTRSLNAECADNIIYDESGGVYCVCPASGERRELAYCGFEEARLSLKYRCPAAAFGLECAGRICCPGGASEYGRIVRIPLATDRRIFTPIARSSYAFVRKYKRRTAVERVNSRLDVSFGFEQHTVRGLKKMRVKVGLALVVMLALAVGSIKMEQRERMRSLVKAVQIRQAS